MSIMWNPTSVLLLLSTSHFVMSYGTSVFQRVIFQAFPIPHTESDTVQCYGGCDAGKHKVARCDGRKILLECPNIGDVVNIRRARLGDLNPEDDVCVLGATLTCDVTEVVTSSCKGSRNCNIDTEEVKKKKCQGNIKHVALDIQYVCGPPPTVGPTTTRHLQKEPTTRKTIRNERIKKVDIDAGYKATPIPPTKTDNGNKFPVIPIDRSKKSQSLKPSPSTKNIDTPSSQTNSHKPENSKSSRTSMFWLLSAYTALSDSEFISSNRTHLAMALILSIFVAIVLSMCFCLDYCRRRKKNKEKNKGLLDSKQALVPDVNANNSNEGIELSKQKLLEATNTVPGSAPRHTLISCATETVCRKAVAAAVDGDCEIYTVSPSFPKRNFELLGMTQSNRVSPRHEYAATGALPQPPKHFLEDEHSSASSSCNDLSPTNEFTSSLNTRSSSCDTKSPRWATDSQNTTGSSKATPKLLRELSVLEAEESFLQESELNDSMEASEFEYIDVGQYNEVGQYNANISDNECEEYSDNPRNGRTMTYHRTDNYVVPSNVKFASMNRRATPKDDCEESSKHRTLDMKRMRKNCGKERPSLHKSRSVDEPKRKTFFSSNGTQYVIRSPRRGRIHVMEQRCPATSTMPRGRGGYSQPHKGIYSDNEASRRRRRCQAEYKRTCHCSDQETSLSDLYCKRCGRHDDAHMTCCSSLTSNCQSSHDEDHGPLLSVSKERVAHHKNKHCRVEESGYQSRDTGTDSLCSSTFSTDQEDSRMFLPASSVHRQCRCCSSKREEKLIFVRNTTKQKTPKMSHTYVDIHSYDSSMDDENCRNENHRDESCRDSVKIRKVRTPMTDDGEVCGLDEDLNFSKICRVLSPETVGTASGIETT